MTRALTLVLALTPLIATAADAPTPETIARQEHAFAADAAAMGIRAAFLKWLAPNSVVFSPGPADGIKAYTARQATKAGLAWRPAIAAVAPGGDLGWTTGPWTYRRDSSKSKVDAYGEYVTLWKRQGDGSYRAVLDGGISHGPGPTDPGVIATRPIAAPVGAGRSPLARRRSLWQVDADFGKRARTEGVGGAIAKYGSERMVLLREDMHPVIGIAAAHDSAAARDSTARLMSLAQFVSDGGELGYTYGSWVTTSAAGVDSSYYVHIWHPGADVPWELALEVVIPVPKPAK